MNWSILSAIGGLLLLLCFAAVLLVLPIQFDELKSVWRASFRIAGALCAMGALGLAFLIIFYGTLDENRLLAGTIVLFVGTVVFAGLVFVALPLRLYYFQSMLYLADSVRSRRNKNRYP